MLSRLRSLFPQIRQSASQKFMKLKERMLRKTSRNSTTDGNQDAYSNLENGICRVSFVFLDQSKSFIILTELRRNM